MKILKQQINQPDKKPKTKLLYDINKVESGFEATLPGLLSKSRERIVGTSTQIFATKEDAEQAIKRAKQEIKESLDFASLEKTFSTATNRIDQLPNGKYRVALPGSLNSELGLYLAITYTDFNTWPEAKEYFLQQRAKQEKLTRKPLLEIQINEQERIAFSDLPAFNPNVAPSENTESIPSSIKKYLLAKEKLAGTSDSAGTYQATVKEKNWETNLFSFIASYLEKDGLEIAKRLKIKHLDSLTPKQAIELATEIVIDLTKYKWSDSSKQKGNLLLQRHKTQADNSTVLQLLQQGQLQRSNSNWEGNGVCRNFASAIKAVFEALKAKQTKFSRLRNTYCLYDDGMEEFAPKRENKNRTDFARTGHAWNTFVTISKEGAANATIIDATWAKKNLDTKQIEGLDHTLTRMEPIVQAVGQNLPANAPDKQAHLKHLLSYYLLKIYSTSQDQLEIQPLMELSEEEKTYYKNFALKYPPQGQEFKGLKEEQIITYGQRLIADIIKGRQEKSQRQFFVTRAIALMSKQGVPSGLPQQLIKAIGDVFTEIADSADPEEIATLFNISQQNSELNFSRIFKNYLKDKQLTDYHADDFIFADNKLQRLAVEELKHREGFTVLCNKSPEFRVRLREILPALFIDFSPDTKPDDAAELKYLAKKHYMLQNSLYLAKPQPSAEDIKNFFAKARQSLQKINPQKYDEKIAELDDYQIIKRFAQLIKELKS